MLMDKSRINAREHPFGTNQGVLLEVLYHQVGHQLKEAFKISKRDNVSTEGRRSQLLDPYVSTLILIFRDEAPSRNNNV